ncbi:hypothetical protein COT49_01900 [candidate division WWE3 bacterium CG08_land_8_20_14_0_20_40_13]|uniref:Uncharacterized protein n=1 Tax=candidate division WWE3 bacterium CG08_land_8_20_14_0_20_40_13 TaxID=1975084 RepID=A0A2H0XE73_UNCKA|nr:MAG: hypothetical protein COT49_01900 [candidate division WWE3 bacterium CG08_land_8_20_14_0_20_40_13]
MLDLERIKRPILIVLPLAIGCLVVAFFSLKILNKGEINNQSAVPATDFSEAFIDPSKVLSGDLEIVGTVVALDLGEGQEFEFKLVGKDNKIIAYLLSKGELLKFVQGREDIKLMGRVQSKTADGVDIIYVKSVSLK